MAARAEQEEDDRTVINLVQMSTRLVARRNSEGTRRSKYVASEKETRLTLTRYRAKRCRKPRHGPFNIRGLGRFSERQ